MRGRILTASGIVLLITLIYIFTPKSSIRAHIPGNYPYVKPGSPEIYAPTPAAAQASPAPAEKLIVKVQLEGEDLNWLLKLLPGWRNRVITIDSAFAHLHTSSQRVDKGRIADAYLSWIISNYNNLPATIAFVPPSLHTQESDKSHWRIPNKSLLAALQSLNTTHVQSAGYAPLHCPSRAQCADTVLPFRHPPDEFRTLEVKMAKAWQGLFNDTRVPEELSCVGGSAFVVSRTQVLRRSVQEWTRYWEWVARTKMDDDSAGAVVERVWHVVFGREAVWCPKEEDCECEVFGRC